MTRICVLALLACSGSGKPPDHPSAPVDLPLRIRIQVAQLEAKRGDGIAELVKLATGGERPAKLLALRGLGRVGGTMALATLSAALRDSDPEIIDIAAEAIGIATSLDEDTAGTPAVGGALLDAYAKRPDDARLIEAIGRAAEGSAQTVLAKGLQGTPAIATASAIALGRFGRRKIELSDETRERLIAATRHVDPKLRFAAAYALAREHLVKPEESSSAKSKSLADAGRALASLLADRDHAIQAQAAQALVRRKLLLAYGVQLSDAAASLDWKVAVEAMRGIVGEGSNDFLRERAMAITLNLVKGLGGEGMRVGPDAAHVVLEALKGLGANATPELWRKHLPALRAASAKVKPPLTRSWIECLIASADVRTMEKPDYASLVDATCGLLDHLRLPLAGELIAAKIGTVEARRAALRSLLDHGDPRVRVAGMTAFAAMWPDGGAADHKATVAMTIASLGVDDGLIAGTAIETAEALYEHIDKATATDLRDQLDAALLARAQTEQDPELATALYGTIGKRKLAGGAAACRAGVRGAPVLARAAVECLKNLGEVVELPPIAAAKAPPVDVVAVIGKQPRWKLATTRGEIVIELRPDLAPWAVATIVALTRKGFYDGLELHRVVPNFVAQGGDPTQSGWGGPGFAIPAEPSSGAGYVEGGVGMADAGRDSAGSQWFIMHGPAPHLDGRYTRIGRVISGQSAANSLLIGDAVLAATIEFEARP